MIRINNVSGSATLKFVQIIDCEQSLYLFLFSCKTAVLDHGVAILNVTTKLRSGDAVPRVSAGPENELRRGVPK